MGTISYHLTEKLVNELLEMGTPEGRAKLTLYEESPPPRGCASNPVCRGHGATYLTYNDSAMFDWLLTHNVSSVHSNDKAASVARGSQQTRMTCLMFAVIGRSVFALF